MGGEYDFDLPSMSDDSWSSGASDSYGADSVDWSSSQKGEYNLSGDYLPKDADIGSDYNLGTNASSVGGDYNFNDQSWYVNSEGTDPSMFNDLWSWSKTNQGVSVLGGVTSAAFQTYQQQKAQERADKLRREALAAQGPSGEELRDARIKVHNASINMPMNMGLTKLKRP